MALTITLLGSSYPPIKDHHRQLSHISKFHCQLSFKVPKFRYFGKDTFWSFWKISLRYLLLELTVQAYCVLISNSPSSTVKVSILQIGLIIHLDFQNCLSTMLCVGHSVVFDSFPPHGLQPTRFLSMEFRQEYCNGQPFPFPEDILTRSSALQADS